MSDLRLNELRDLIQQDPGHRGLATVPGDNLISALPEDFANACRSIADHKLASVCVVTGFFIPTADPPTGETDGPLGAIFLARALTAAGIRVVLATDPFCMTAMWAGLDACDLGHRIKLEDLPTASEAMSADEYRAEFADRMGPVTHLVALERVGPTRLPSSFSGSEEEEYRRLVGPEHRGRCHTMRGRDITTIMRPAHLLFECPHRTRLVTIGIGDGGNEIGMGKLSWDVIRRNIPGGDRVACRTATDHLIVCGVSNWGAYALAAGVLRLRGVTPPPDLFDVERERKILSVMVERGPLVDGVFGRPSVTVDGLSFERYAEVLEGCAP